jgi:hypothetical protein
VLDDELDERDGRGLAADGRPVTYIWDISDLENPRQTGYYKAPRITIDHNQYVVNNYSYQSNYGAGISILDVSSIPADPTGAGVKEVGWFDIYPEGEFHFALKFLMLGTEMLMCSRRWTSGWWQFEFCGDLELVCGLSEWVYFDQYY